MRVEFNIAESHIFNQLNVDHYKWMSCTLYYFSTVSLDLIKIE